MPAHRSAATSPLPPGSPPSMANTAFNPFDQVASGAASSRPSSNSSVWSRISTALHLSSSSSSARSPSHKSSSICLDSQLSSYLEYHSNLYHQEKFKRYYIQYDTILTRLKSLEQDAALGPLLNEIWNICSLSNHTGAAVQPTMGELNDANTTTTTTPNDTDSKQTQNHSESILREHNTQQLAYENSFESHVPGHGLTILTPSNQSRISSATTTGSPPDLPTPAAASSSTSTSRIPLINPPPSRRNNTAPSSSYGSINQRSNAQNNGTSVPRTRPQTPHHPLLKLIFHDIDNVHECYVSRVRHINQLLHHIQRSLNRSDDSLDNSNNYLQNQSLNLENDRSKIKKLIKETYRKCQFVESFCQLNMTALKQICKQLQNAQLLYLKNERDISLQHIRYQSVSSPYSDRTASSRRRAEWSQLKDSSPSSSDEDETPLHSRHRRRHTETDSLLDDTFLPDSASSSSIRATVLHTRDIFRSFSYCSPFSSLDAIEDIMNQLHDLYAQHFCSSNHEKARSQLMKPYIKHNQKDIFKFAFTVGFLVPVVILLVGLVIGPPSTIEVNGFWDVFPVFRPLLLVILYIWLFGLDVYVWQKRKVNHMYLLELKPSSTLDHVKIFKTAAIFTCIWAIYFVLYLGHAKGKLDIIPIDVKWYPLAAIITMATMCMLPVHMFHLGARLTILKGIQHLIILPFGQCKFVHNFMADVFTSMAVPLSDVSYTICYYTTNAWNEHSELNQCHEWNTLLGPCLSFLPYYWRLMQCLRVYHDTKQKAQLVNAGKYLSSLLVIVLNALHSNIESSQQWGTFRIFWIVSVIFSTLYSFSWDIKMDWGLLQLQHGTLLRPKLMYPKLFYPLLAIFNLFARFAWAGTLATYISNRMYFLKLLFGAIEILRRAMWSMVRLEWAQLSNAEKYRKSRFVPEVVFVPQTGEKED